MLGLVRFPWRKVIGLALIALLLLPVLDQASAASRASATGKTLVSDRGEDLSSTLDRNQDEGGGKDPPCVPSDEDGDPDDYGYLPPWVERVLFLLNLIR